MEICYNDLFDARACGDMLNVWYQAFGHDHVEINLENMGVFCHHLIKWKEVRGIDKNLYSVVLYQSCLWFAAVFLKKVDAPEKRMDKIAYDLKQANESPPCDENMWPSGAALLWLVALNEARS